ncbi:hypothetical protein BJ166DRAFT_491302 [Pestalotiopsis sp. NC0098]|nr:hypothetical protein BJ166DRAFT_491302 [Pestalotiopsis sp. NC0098]
MESFPSLCLCLLASSCLCGKYLPHLDGLMVQHHQYGTDSVNDFLTLPWMHLANDTLHSSGLHPCNLGTCGSAAAVLLGECPSLSVTLSQLESLVLVSRAEHGRAIVGHVPPGPT